MRRFFFADESPRPAALLRIVLSSLLLCEAAVRWPSAIELFSSDGRPIPTFPGSPFEPPALGAAATVVLHTLLLWSLASAAVGWKTRISLLTAAVLSTWLGLLDLPGTYKKYTVIALHLMALLSLANSGGAWAIDAWLGGGGRGRGIGGWGLETGADDVAPFRRSPLWPRRLMQIFLCSVYLGAAVTKIRMADFASGEMLEFALLGDEFGGKPAGHWLVRHPGLLTASSMATILFEVLFPALVWVPRLRRPMLLLAALFHLALQATMHLGLFSWVMLAGLLAFVTDADLDAAGSLLARLRRNGAQPDGGIASVRSRSLAFRAASQAAWLFCAVAFAAGGLAVQRAADWYGVFHGQPLGGRTAVPQDLVDDVLFAQAPAYEDYVHRMEIGTRLANGRALGESTRFHRGTIVRAAVRFVQRHPSMKLDWLLIAPDGREAARLTRHLDEAISHAVAGFEITGDAPPGRYRVILETDGYEVAERAFEVVE